MKHNSKNLCRRGLALFLALVMCLSMIQLTALAAEDDPAGTADHVHNAEGWICTPYCDIPEHIHSAECYGPADSGIGEKGGEENSDEPVSLPDDVLVNDGTNTETDDFGNEYEPPVYIGPSEGDGDPEGPEEGGPAALPEGPEEGDEPTAQPEESEEGGDKQPATEPENPEEGDDKQPAEPENPEGDGDKQPAEPENPEGDGDKQPAEPENPEEGGDKQPADEPENPEGNNDPAAQTGEPEEGGEPVALDESPVPMAPAPVLVCGLEEHTHTDDCAQREGGGWHCVPDTNITINVPDTKTVGGMVDLLKGVTATPAYCGNWEVQIAVVSVVTEDGQELEPRDGQWLEVEDGVVYTVEYAAYVSAAATLGADDPAGQGQNIPEGILAYQTRQLEGEALQGAAQIGDAWYETLQAALDAAVELDNPTICLLTDVYENVTSTASYTLDLQGHTVHSGVEGKNVFTITGGDVTIQNGAITGGDWGGDNTTMDGKGICAINVSLTLVNCEITDNSGNTNATKVNGTGIGGGGIGVYKGTLTLDGCTVSGSEASGDGGGINANGCAVTLKGGTKLLNNVSGGNGGGIYVDGGTLSMDGAVINGNSGNNGAGLYLNNAGADIKNVEISGNGDGKDRTSVYVTSTADAPVSFTNVDISQQGSVSLGKVVYVYMTKNAFTAEKCTLHDSMGGWYLSGLAEKTFKDCQFLDNECMSNTNGATTAPLYIASGSANVNGCTFTGNTAKCAGAIYQNSTGTLTIDGCLISGNSAFNASTPASAAAGGIYATKGTITVTNTVIKGNSTASTYMYSAGGVYLSSTTPIFNMTSGALYNNKCSSNSKANDIRIVSDTSSVLKASDMKDGDVDFSTYVWSDLQGSHVTDAAKGGSWTATPAAEFVASVGGTGYKTLDEAFVAARAQSRETGENVTVEVVEGYIPLSTYYGVSQGTGKNPASVTIHLNNTNVYGIGSASTNSFSISAGNTLTLSGTGTLNKKIYMMGGTLNLDGNVVVSGSMNTNILSAANAPIYSKASSTYAGFVNINGSVDKVQLGLAMGAVTVGPNAHVGSLEISTNTGIAASTYVTDIAINGSVDTLSILEANGASTTTLNGHIGSMTLNQAIPASKTSPLPTVVAGENCLVDTLNVIPSLGISSSYDDNGRETTGKISIYALQDPTKSVSDLLVIQGGGSKVTNATWTTTLNNKHTDQKDYKFLTSVVADENGNLVLRKTTVAGNYILVDGTAGDDSNDGTSLGTPVKTFKKAKEILDAQSEINVIHVLGTIQVTESETWELGEGRSLEPFPTYKGILVSVPQGATLNLENITIDGKGIERSGPLVENSGTLNIEGDTKLTGGINTATFKMEDHSVRDGGAIWNGGTLNMTGGVVEGNSARSGGGIFSSGTFNLEGGEIRGNEGYGSEAAYSKNTKYVSVNAGGGVFLGLGGTMNMSGGTISGNRAGMGGGISMGNKTNAYTYDKATNLVMTGGVIDGNTSDSEGGGIYVQENCVATITSGKITNNRSLGGAFGGGGIYVNGGVTQSSINGKLYLTNVAVVNNTASGSGGGIAGCPTSNLSIYLSDGGVIANNQAGGEAYDIFIQRSVGDPNHTGKTGTALISKYMLGGGLYNWIDRKTGERMASQNFQALNVFLYGTPAAEDVALAEEQCTVTIEGNTANTAGGGIGSNGDVTIGKKGGTFNIDFNKQWLNADGTEMTQDQLEAVKEKLVYMGFALWRRQPARAAFMLLSEDTLDSPEQTPEQTPEGSSINFVPPEGEGWELVDWMYRGRYYRDGKVYISNSGDYWGEMYFEALISEGYEYALTEITSSAYQAVKKPAVFTSSDWKSVLKPDGGCAFVNQLQPATLILEKKINGSDESLASMEFTFEITLTTPDGTKYQLEQKLMGGKSVTIKTLDGTELIPVGTTYTIQEINYPERCYVSSEGISEANDHPKVSSGDKISDTLEMGTTTVTFTNSFDPFGTLTVEKAVTGGTEADQTRDWAFMIRLFTEESGIQSALSNEAISKIDFGGEVSQKDANNTYTYVQVNLKHGERYKIDYLPLGVCYEVEEIKGADFPADCVVTYQNESGKIEDHGDNFTAKVTNALPEQPKPQPKFTSLEVNKVWNDGGAADKRPGSILVALRNGSGIQEYVKLEAANNWHYEWNELDAKETWTVDEVGIHGYTSVKTQEGNVVTITNTPKNPDNPPDNTPDDPPSVTEIPDPNVPGAPEEITVVDEEVPLTYVKVWDPEEEEFVYIPEDDVPLVNMVPKTGDSFAAAFWTVLCLTSGAGLAALYVTKPRKKDEA